MHAVPAFLIEHGGNILESQQFGDRPDGRFFMRIDFAIAAAERTAEYACAPDFARGRRALRDDLRAVGRRGRRTGP